MTNEPPTLAAVLGSLAEFGHNCVPANFADLLGSVDALKSVATVAAQLETEDELDTAAIAFNNATRQFYFVAQESRSMHLLHSEASGQTENARIDRALASPARRTNFLVALNELCRAAFCGVALRRNRNSVNLWIVMTDCASTWPGAAMFAPPIDPDAFLGAFLSKRARYLEGICESLGEMGSTVIDLNFSLDRLENYANALWLKLLQNGPDEALFERARQLYHRALYFLESPPNERWILQRYTEILPNDSLRAILDELLSHDLELVPGIHDPTATPEGKIFPNRVPICRLTEGRIRKRRYVALLPRSGFFLVDYDELLLNSFAERPLQFVREHLEDVPRSILAEEIRKRVGKIEDLQNDEKLAVWAKTVAAGLTANALSLALCNSLSLPAEARAFITVFVSSLVALLVGRHSD